MKKTLVKIILLFLSLTLIGCELNRTQTSVLTGALDRYQENNMRRMQRV